MCDPSRDLLEPLFTELEFRTLGKRVFGDGFSVTTAKFQEGTQTDLFGNQPGEAIQYTNTIEEEPVEKLPAKTIENTEHNYQLVDTAEKRADLIKLLLAQSRISFDTETTGTDANMADLVGLSFSIKPGEGYYISCFCS